MEEDPREKLKKLNFPLTLADTETFTIDEGGREFTWTGSATSNSAIASLLSLPTSPERTAACLAQMTIAKMSVATLKRECSVLTGSADSCGIEFGYLPAPAVLRMLEFELTGREKAIDAKRNLRDQILVNSVVAVVTAILTLVATWYSGF